MSEVRQGIVGDNQTSANGISASLDTDKAFAPDSFYQEELNRIIEEELGSQSSPYKVHLHEDIQYGRLDTSLERLCEDDDLNQLALNEIAYNTKLKESLDKERENDMKMQMMHQKHREPEGGLSRAFNHILNKVQGGDKYERRFNNLKQEKYLSTIENHTKQGREQLERLAVTASVFTARYDNYLNIKQAATDAGEPSSPHATIAQRELQASYELLQREMQKNEKLAAEGLFSTMDVENLHGHMKALHDMGLGPKMADTKRYCPDTRDSDPKIQKAVGETQDEAKINDAISSRIMEMLDTIATKFSLTSNNQDVGQSQAMTR